MEQDESDQGLEVLKNYWKSNVLGGDFVTYVSNPVILALALVLVKLRCLVKVKPT